MTHLIKTYIFIFACMAFFLNGATASAANAGFVRAERFGGGGNDYTVGIDEDGNGNTYVVGYITGTADINGNGTTTDPFETVASPYGGVDIVLVKFDPNWNVLWYKRFGGTGNDFATIYLKVNGDKVVLSERIDGAGDMNGDGDTLDTQEASTTAPFGGIDAFITVFDTDGNPLWQKRFGGTGSEFPYSLSFDSSGDIIVSGLRSPTADMNGDGDTTDLGETSASPYGGTGDGFVAVYDIDNGDILMNKKFGGANNTDGARAVSINESGNRFVVIGHAEGVGDLNGDGDTTDFFEASTTAPFGSTDIFISVFDENWNNLWYKRLGSTGNDSGSRHAVFDNDGNIFVGFTLVPGGTASDLNSDGDTLDEHESADARFGSADFFLEKWTADGTLIWSKKFGGLDSDNLWDVAVDSSNHYLFSAYVKGTSASDLNGDGDMTDVWETVTEASGSSANDLYLGAVDEDGNFLWGKKIGGTGADNAYSLSVSSNGEVSYAGGIIGSVDFNSDGDTADDAETPESFHGGADALLLTLLPDYSNPTISLDSPSASTHIHGTVSLTATATDNNAVSGVKFYANNTLIGSEDTTSPYSVSWDTTATSSESKTLVAVARDSAGNYSTSTSVLITVDNETPSTPIITTPSGSTNSATITISGTAESGTTITITGGSGTETGTSDGSFSISVSLTHDTENTLSITATDTAGNVSSASSVVITHVSPGVASIAYIPITPVVVPHLLEPNPPQSENSSQTLTLANLISQLQTLLQQAREQGIPIPPGAESFFSSSISFTKNLHYGIIDDEVLLLQKKLNTFGYTVSPDGPGSIGNESTYFGVKTQIALRKFQCQEMGICSGMPTTTGYGNFGPATRGKIGER